MCSFCRVAPARKNREHLLPDWLSTVFPSGLPQTHYRRAQTPSGHRDRIYEQRPFRAKTGCTCVSCNTGWMSRIEDESKVLLRSLMRSPLSVVLTRHDQVLLSQWAFLRFLVFQQARGDGPQAVPDEHYAYVYEHRRPPAGVQIWIGRRAHEGAWPYRFLSLAGEWRPGKPQPREPVGIADFNIYQAALMVGHLVVYFSGRLDGGAPIVHSADFRDALVEIWPSKPRHVWPPGRQVDSGRLEAMFDMTGRYVDRAA